MDPRLLKYYNQELKHLREVGVEFLDISADDRELIEQVLVLPV